MAMEDKGETMKKQSFIFGIMLIMLLAMGTSLMAVNYVVSGAGTTEANGTYILQEGLVDGEPWHKKLANDYVIVSFFGMFWDIDTDDGTTLYMVTKIGNPTPPETGWELYMGAAPAPTVTEEGPTPVILSNFTAQYASNALSLYWTTQSEANNSGWNIYRGESEEALQNDESIQINTVLVPGAGTTSEPTDYVFVDENEVVEGSTYWYWIESRSNSGETDTFGPISFTIPFEGEDPDNPDLAIYSLFNYPNPLSNSTSIRFNLPEATNCELTIFNIKGKIVRTYLKNNVMNGEFIWNGKDENGNNVSSGIYFYKLNTGDETYIRKMILTK